MSTTADIEESISLVRSGRATVVQAILDRALAQETSAGKALVKLAGNSLLTVQSKGVLSRVLGIAMAHHGRMKSAPSLRPTAPDTKGRSFHFSHTMINKMSKPNGKKAASPEGGSAGHSRPASTAVDMSGGRIKLGGVGRASEGASTCPASGANQVSGSKERAHQKYLERDAALARDEVETFGIPIAGLLHVAPDLSPLLDQQPETETRIVRTHQEETRDVDLDSAGLPKTTEQALHERQLQSAPAAQKYIEDPSKVAPEIRHGHSNSFGTIGETFEERMAFWDDLHQHEREKDGRTQHRLVLELPHEATPAARQEIVKLFCKRYEELGVPYWAAIHSPTEKNDPRNHHAHIVHANRPAQQMIDPATGGTAWDFTITKTSTKKNRVKKTSHPYRQDVPGVFRDRAYLKVTRYEFATITNEVMKRHECAVRYDPRSYKDMGLGIKPTKDVSRVVLDQAKSGDLVIVDPEWVRRLIELEEQIAVSKHDRKYAEFKEFEKQMAVVANDIRQLREANRRLPKTMRLSLLSQLSVSAAERISNRMAMIEQARIGQRFADEQKMMTIEEIVSATALDSALRNGKPPKLLLAPGEPVPLSPEVMAIATAMLHESALEERLLHKSATSGRMRKLAMIAVGAMAEWQALAQPTQPVTQPQPEPAKARSRPGPMPASARPNMPPPAQRGPAASASARDRGLRTTDGAGSHPTRLDEHRQRPTAAPIQATGQNMRPRARSDAWQTGQMPLLPGFAKAVEPMSGRNVNAMFAMAQSSGPGGPAALIEMIKAKTEMFRRPENQMPPRDPGPPHPDAREPKPQQTQPVDAKERSEQALVEGELPPSTARRRPVASVAPEPRTTTKTSERPTERIDGRQPERPQATDRAAGAATTPRMKEVSQGEAPAHNGPTGKPRMKATPDAAGASIYKEGERPAEGAPEAPQMAQVTLEGRAGIASGAAASKTGREMQSEIEDIDIVALMAGRHTSTPLPPKPANVIKPKGIHARQGPLSKTASKPQSRPQLDAGYEPAHNMSAFPAPVGKNAAEPTPLQHSSPTAKSVEVAGEPQLDREAESKAIKRRKSRRRVRIVQQNGWER